VEVRSQEEILATLDDRGQLENLPFMPEMLQYCGRKFRVFKRADKACDNIVGWSIRRMGNSVHLEGLRCDGTGHDGCEAGCMIFWKEAWLRRTDSNLVSEENLLRRKALPAKNAGFCTVESLITASQSTNAEKETIYSCQATELRNFTSFMHWWDPRQYVRDFQSGNLSSDVGDSFTENLLELVLGILQGIRAFIISLFRRRGIAFPIIRGTTEKTPSGVLDLQPGELVRVRSKDEIVATLNSNSKNRGLYFGPEMTRYCGGIYRVLRRVHHIVDEKTGKMLHMKQPCIVLEGVWCQMSDYFRFCPKAIYHYWREIWLERVEVQMPAAPEQVQETCENVRGHSNEYLYRF
jgi:hypothetical protein